MHIQNQEQFDRLVAEIEGRPGYRRPQAWAVGITTLSLEGRMLSVSFPHPNYQGGYGAAAIFADAVGHLSGTDTYEIREVEIQMLLDAFTYHIGDGGAHPNIDTFLILTAYIEANGGVRDEYFSEDATRGPLQSLVVSFIDQVEHDSGPRSVADAYLRFHLHSHGLTRSPDLKLELAAFILSNNDAGEISEAGRPAADASKDGHTATGSRDGDQHVDLATWEGLDTSDLFDAGAIHNTND